MCVHNGWGGFVWYWRDFSIGGKGWAFLQVLMMLVITQLTLNRPSLQPQHPEQHPHPFIPPLKIMQESILNQFNNADLLELDPLVTRGYRLYKQFQVNIFIKIQGAKGVTQVSQQPLLIKTYVKEHKRKQHTTLQSFLIDFLSEQDLFFHFRCQLSQMDFKRLRDDQQLLCQYKDLPNLFCTLVESLTKTTNTGCLETLSESKSIFSFQQTVNQKEFELLVLEAYREDEEVLRQMVAYRYGVMRTEIDKMEGRAIDIREMMRVKCPYLLGKFDSF